MVFNILKRKSGTILTNIGHGHIHITVEFQAKCADIKFISRKIHANCHHAAPDSIHIEIVEATRRRSKLKISWYVKHQSLARYIVTG